MCDVCKNRGWLLTRVYRSAYFTEGFLHIEKCDACDKYQCDDEAEKVAKEQNFIVRNNRLANKNTGKFSKLNKYLQSS